MKTVAAAEALKRVGAPDTVFVDVREPPEMAATGVITGAVKVPLSQLATLADRGNPGREAALFSGKELVFYCATGRRSAHAAQALERQGIGRTVNLAGGIVAWAAAGGPVEADSA